MEWLGDLWNWFRGDDNKPTPTPNPTPTPTPAPAPATNDDDALLKLHNSKRASAYPLVINDKLTLAARKHAQWMAANENMSHNEGRKTVADRAKAEGYAWNYVGENIAMGYPNVDAVFKGWMNSPGHRANILNKNYKDVGFGVVKSPRGSLYWCAVFGKQG